MKRLHTLLRTRREEGSLSAFFVLLAVILMAMIGLVVDSAGKYAEAEHAQLVASSSARAGVNAISGTAQDTGTTSTNNRVAQAAAEDYLTAAGMTGTVTVNGTTVTVTVYSTYDTRFVSLLGITQLPAEATATAQLLTD